jgi:FtsZ-interacting cell division protein YlmF
VPGNHNAKLIYPKENPQSPPFVVPYDFDHSGFVNADYATPSEIIGTEKVTERVYRGYPRTMEELETVFDIFRKKKENIYSLIMNFTPLKEKTRKGIVDYLDDFYKTINSKSQAKSVFIDNARTN